MRVLYTDECSSTFSFAFFSMLTDEIVEYLDMDLPDDCEVSLLMTDDESIREMNLEFRGKDSATDVLSFPMEEETMLGDIVISLDTALRQASDAEIAAEREVAFLYIHGFLHLLGFDHELGDEEEKEMFALQEDILRVLVESGRVK